MDNLPLHYQPWTDRFAMDISLLLEKSGDTLDDVLNRHGIKADQLGKYNADPLFLKKVNDLRAEVRENGITFKLKARAQAEELLTTSWSLIHSPDVSAAVKADLIKSTVKWAGLEPKNDAQIEGVGGGVTISINLAGQQHTATLKDATPDAQQQVLEHEA
jgi:hypothetical protein